MGCSRSKIQPLICQKDEEEYLKQENEKCKKLQMYLSPRMSSTNIGLLSVETKENTNSGGSVCPTCPASSWIAGEIPEIIIGVLVLLFICWIWRKYAAYKRGAAIRQAVLGGQQMSLPSISRSVVSRDYGFLDK